MVIKYTLEQAYDRVTRDVKIWCRFDSIDNLLPKPTDQEIQIAANIAVDDINTTPPLSNVTLLGSVTANDAYYTTIMYGTCKNILWTLLMDWTANGIDAQLDSLSLESRRPYYEQLFQTANENFTNRLEKLKASLSLRIVSSQHSNRHRKSILKTPFHGVGFAAAIPTVELNRP
jgi:hypothetical protein